MPVHRIIILTAVYICIMLYQGLSEILFPLDQRVSALCREPNLEINHLLYEDLNRSFGSKVHYIFMSTDFKNHFERTIDVALYWRSELNLI